jgi:hypothetical protein
MFIIHCKQDQLVKLETSNSKLQEEGYWGKKPFAREWSERRGGRVGANYKYLACT